MENACGNYLSSTQKLFNYYKGIAEKAIEALSDEQLYWQYNAQSNSIAIIIKHIAGNSISRWTDFLTTDGEKEWRNRDDEFENDVLPKQQLLALWERGWQCIFDAL